MTPPAHPAPPIVPGAVHRAEVVGRDPHGRGLAHLGRRELRVPQGLPGEVLEVRLTHVGRHVAVGRIERVVRASPDRVEDACPHGAVCPGCGLRTTSLHARREHKRARLEEALRRAGLGEVSVALTVPAPREDGWRHKAYLTARRTRRGLFLGLYESHTHRLLGIEGCPAHAPAVEDALAATRRALDAHDPPVYDERSGEGWLRYVSVRASAATGEAVVVLVAAHPDFGGARDLASSIREAAPHVRGVAMNVNPSRGNAPFGDRFESLAGESFLEEASGPLRLRVSVGSFFQVNPPVGEAIHDAVQAAARAAPPGSALDLYGGVGATALRLAADGRDVTLVEVPGPAAEDAAYNVRKAAPGRVQVAACRMEEWTGPLSDAAVVVANPPRSGLPPALTAALGEAPPPLLAYVSCDPTSLARDLAVLRGSALRVESVTPFDLMPQTPHVEALAVLRRMA